MKEEIYCNIKGRVQLVMFRDFSQRKAKKLGLSGWVKNLNDGSVDLLAQGERDELEKYVELLNKGPIFAKVDSVHTVWRKPKEVLYGFSIRY